MANEDSNRWAAELLGWGQAESGLWSRVGSLSHAVPDFVHNLGACPPLLKMVGSRARFYWNEAKECWTCSAVAVRPSRFGFQYFHSPEPEPGGCIVEAAQYVFGEERDD